MHHFIVIYSLLQYFFLQQVPRQDLPSKACRSSPFHFIFPDIVSSRLLQEVLQFTSINTLAPSVRRRIIGITLLEMHEITELCVTPEFNERTGANIIAEFHFLTFIPSSCFHAFVQLLQSTQDLLFLSNPSRGLYLPSCIQVIYLSRRDKYLNSLSLFLGQVFPLSS